MDVKNQIKLDYDKYELLLLAFELHGITIIDLIMQKDNIQDLLKRLSRQPRELEEFINEILNAEAGEKCAKHEPTFIQTGISELDEIWGGIPVGKVTEIFGASGTAKSQFLFQLSCLSQLNSRNKVIFINTETFLETRRLSSITQGRDDPSISMDNIDYIYCQDLEIFDHVLYTQLPIQLEKCNEIRTVIIDSIGHHLRKEESATQLSFLRDQVQQQYEQDESQKNLLSYYKRKNELQFNTFFKTNEKYDLRFNKKTYILELYKHLSNLARRFNVAFIFSNQVSDQVKQSDKEKTTHDEYVLDLDYSIGSMVGWDDRTIKEYQNSGEINGLQFETYIAGAYKAMKVSSDSNPRLQDVNESISNIQDYGLKTKLHVPSLGYQWIKHIDTRILLSKSYKPIIDSERLKEELENQAGPHLNKVLPHQNLELPLAANTQMSEMSLLLLPLTRKRRYIPDSGLLSKYISEWIPIRQMKIVHLPHSVNKEPHVSKRVFPFRIISAGLQAD